MILEFVVDQYVQSVRENQEIDKRIWKFLFLVYRDALLKEQFRQCTIISQYSPSIIQYSSIEPPSSLNDYEKIRLLFLFTNVFPYLLALNEWCVHFLNEEGTSVPVVVIDNNNNRRAALTTRHANTSNVLHLDVPDREVSNSIFAKVWDCLLRGDQTELLQRLESIGEHWIHGVLSSGGVYASDPDNEFSLDYDHALVAAKELHSNVLSLEDSLMDSLFSPFHRVVFSVSSETIRIGPNTVEEFSIGNRWVSVMKSVAKKACVESSYSSYEKAIWGYTCGDISAMLPVCRSELEFIFAHTIALQERLVSAFLATSDSDDWNEICLEKEIASLFQTKSTSSEASEFICCVMSPPQASLKKFIKFVSSRQEMRPSLVSAFVVWRPRLSESLLVKSDVDTWHTLCDDVVLASLFGSETEVSLDCQIKWISSLSEAKKVNASAHWLLQSRSSTDEVRRFVMSVQSLLPTILESLLHICWNAKNAFQLEEAHYGTFLMALSYDESLRESAGTGIVQKYVQRLVSDDVLNNYKATVSKMSNEEFLALEDIDIANFTLCLSMPLLERFVIIFTDQSITEWKERFERKFDTKLSAVMQSISMAVADTILDRIQILSESTAVPTEIRNCIIQGKKQPGIRTSSVLHDIIKFVPELDDVVGTLKGCKVSLGLLHNFFLLLSISDLLLSLKDFRVLVEDLTYHVVAGARVDLTNCRLLANRISVDLASLSNTKFKRPPKNSIPYSVGSLMSSIAYKSHYFSISPLTRLQEFLKFYLSQLPILDASFSSLREIVEGVAQQLSQFFT